jgi:hypothetical protein
MSLKSAPTAVIGISVQSGACLKKDKASNTKPLQLISREFFRDRPVFALFSSSREDGAFSLKIKPMYAATVHFFLADGDLQQRE